MVTLSAKNTPSPAPLLAKTLVAAHEVQCALGMLDADFDRRDYLFDESRSASESVRDRNRYPRCARRPARIVGVAAREPGHTDAFDSVEGFAKSSPIRRST